MTYLNFHNCTDCHGVSFIASPPHSPHAPCSLPNCFSLNAPKLLCMQIAICARKRHTDCSSTDYDVGINGDNNGRGSTVARRRRRGNCKSIAHTPHHARSQWMGQQHSQTPTNSVQQPHWRQLSNMAQHKDKHARVWKWRKGQPAGQSASEPIGVCGAATSTLLLLLLHPQHYHTFNNSHKGDCPYNIYTYVCICLCVCVCVD